MFIYSDCNNSFLIFIKCNLSLFGSIHTLYMLGLLVEKHLQCSTYLPEDRHLL